eukprot:TRINITY_DN114433_c0_g1_i1.p1 TRINITY_DN114433_c0_g1~~TRINITY_DN114433_c0_g1_i1.p1  ORF type:complete len:406 (-),score=78.97 TRINITY_DN114433_c0_g1_i1:30-1247(-)
MPKQQKGSKGQSSAATGSRWVVKGQDFLSTPPASVAQKRPATASAPAREKRAAKGEETPLEVTLEEFKALWEPVPDENLTSNKDYYFNSYAHFGIHEDMLKDQVRTSSYMKAILHNQKLFEGKTVLDVGSGTGILCLFAAKAGAKKVIGIECCDIIDYAKEIAQANGYGDTITYVRGKCEDVELPVDSVDIIISEWMGYFLIYESMLDSVLFARDKWLTKGGHLFPDRAKLYMAAIEDADYKEEKIGFWGVGLVGFDFTPVQASAIQEPISDIVHKEAIATSTCCVLDVDLKTAKIQDLDFFAPWRLEVKRQDLLHALVTWFDVSFEACSPPLTMTTAPGKPSTHWKQTVLYFEEALAVYPGEEISGMIAVRKNPQNPRDIDVKLQYELSGKHAMGSTTQYYRMR